MAKLERVLKGNVGICVVNMLFHTIHVILLTENSLKGNLRELKIFKQIAEVNHLLFYCRNVDTTLL